MIIPEHAAIVFNVGSHQCIDNIHQHSPRNTSVALIKGKMRRRFRGQGRKSRKKRGRKHKRKTRKHHKKRRTKRRKNNRKKRTKRRR